MLLDHHRPRLPDAVADVVFRPEDDGVVGVWAACIRAVIYRACAGCTPESPAAVVNVTAE